MWRERRVWRRGARLCVGSGARCVGRAGACCVGACCVCGAGARLLCERRAVCGHVLSVRSRSRRMLCGRRAVCGERGRALCRRRAVRREAACCVGRERGAAAAAPRNAASVGGAVGEEGGGARCAETGRVPDCCVERACAVRRERAGRVRCVGRRPRAVCVAAAHHRQGLRSGCSRSSDCRLHAPPPRRPSIVCFFDLPRELLARGI